MEDWSFISIAKLLLPLCLLFLPHKAWLRSLRGWWRRKRRPSVRSEMRRIAAENRLAWRLISNPGRLVALAARNLLGGLGLFGMAGLYYYIMYAHPIPGDAFFDLLAVTTVIGPGSAGVFVLGYDWRLFAAVSSHTAESRLFLRPLRRHLRHLGVPPEQIAIRVAKLRSGRGDPLGKLVDKEKGLIAPSLRIAGERRKR